MVFGAGVPSAAFQTRISPRVVPPDLTPQEMIRSCPGLKATSLIAPVCPLRL
jgi:hypothetical protein